MSWVGQGISSGWIQDSGVDDVNGMDIAEIGPGDLSAGDIMLMVIRWHLAADSTLAAIFSDDIHVRGNPPPATYWLNPPSLWLYLVSAAQERLIGKGDGKTIEVFFGVTQGVEEDMSVGVGEPTIDSVYRHIDVVLSKLHQIYVITDGSSDPIVIAEHGESTGKSYQGALTFDDRYVELSQQGWSWEVEVDHLTGRIRRLPSGGGGL